MMHLRFVSLFVLSLAPAASAFAQTVAPAPEPVTMSPFQILSDEDTGYRATNTLDGSRLNTPGAIGVFTKDFIDDLVATEVTGAAAR